MVCAMKMQGKSEDCSFNKPAFIGWFGEVSEPASSSKTGLSEPIQWLGSLD
jgi:hypothetical protein